MKKLITNLAHMIGSSFYLIEFLLIFFPLYYFFMLFFYLLIFLFDEGLLSLIKWEENRYAQITTQAFDSFLHIYYYFFYIISLFVSFSHIIMSGLGNYLVSKIYKEEKIDTNKGFDEKITGKLEKSEKNEKNEKIGKNEKIEKNEKIQKIEKIEKSDKSDKIDKNEKFEKNEKLRKNENFQHRRKRKAFLNFLKYSLIAFFLFFCDIYGNFLIREYFPHTVFIEVLFIVLGFGYSRTIYSHVYSYKHGKNGEEQDFIGVPMGYGIMKSVFWGIFCCLNMWRYRMCFFNEFLRFL